MFPIEIDLHMVRRQRETGMKGLGQVLKSFRDRSTDFSIYDRNSGTDAYLKTLGPLEIPQQGSRAGLHVDVPAELMTDAPAYKGQTTTPPVTAEQPAFAPEPLANPTAGTATSHQPTPSSVSPATALSNPPIKSDLHSGTDTTSSG